MGEVWRGADERSGNRPQAIKRVLLGGATQEEAAERQARFERETRLLAALSHPHICNILDVVEEQGCAYLILELIEGARWRRSCWHAGHRGCRRLRCWSGRGS